MTNLFGRATHNLVLSDEVKRAYASLEQELNVVADIQRSLLRWRCRRFQHWNWRRIIKLRIVPG